MSQENQEAKAQPISTVGFKYIPACQSEGSQGWNWNWQQIQIHTVTA